MVDSQLLEDLKANIAAGAQSASVDGSLKVLEFFKQIALEDADVAQELAPLKLRVQIVITDIDSKLWATITGKNVEYGQGDVDDPTFVFSATYPILFEIIMGQKNAATEYLAGNAGIEGNVPDAMSFQSIIELAMEKFNNLIK
jgi:hypothetical protein